MSKKVGWLNWCALTKEAVINSIKPVMRKCGGWTGVIAQVRVVGFVWLS